jgi:hypothetical protein
VPGSDPADSYNTPSAQIIPISVGVFTAPGSMPGRRPSQHPLLPGYFRGHGTGWRTNIGASKRSPPPANEDRLRPSSTRHTGEALSEGANDHDRRRATWGATSPAGAGRPGERPARPEPGGLERRTRPDGCVGRGLTYLGRWTLPNAVLRALDELTEAGARSRPSGAPTDGSRRPRCAACRVEGRSTGRGGGRFPSPRRRHR